MITLMLLFSLIARAGDGLNSTASQAPAPPEPQLETLGVPVSAPDITNVPQPDPAPAMSTAVEVRAAPGGGEPECKQKVAPALRAMVFKHYQNMQDILIARNKPIPPDAPEKAAHLLAMVLKESSGDTTDVTDMGGHEVGTFHAMTDLTRWNELFSHDKIVLDKQTNFGLAQQSWDRLMASNNLSPDLSGLLEIKSASNGARALLGVYQYFAQGRLKQGDTVIPEKVATDPNASAAVKARTSAGLKAAVWHCGSRFLFKEGYAGADGEKKLEDAMATIAYCDVGAKGVDPKDETQLQCFGRWITLCPALNLDIAMLSPDSYFQTRDAAPLCLKTFQSLTRK